MLELNAIPMTKPATATYMLVADQIRKVDARLEQMKSAKTATGAGQPSAAELLRDKRIASLKLQIKDDDDAIARYQTQAQKEAAATATRVASGDTTFNPEQDLR